MKSVGIITIHKINNYGSILQAYALQKVCEDMGYKAEIIDYQFPNEFHSHNPFATHHDTQSSEPKYIKMLFAKALLRQHRGISSFVSRYQQLSAESYASPQQLMDNPPYYDVYITGSDQVWSPRHCNGDPAFLLHFAPDDSIKISYASSIGSDMIPEPLISLYSSLLKRYGSISLRESSGSRIIKGITGHEATTVLDPTLLLDRKEWDKIASPKRIVKKKYILCYFLNYSFNAFPYVDKLTRQIQRETGFEIVRVARPPHNIDFLHTHYRIGASPEEFLALVRDAEIVLTTSFHGTAFAVNYGRPLFSIVGAKNSSDSRQIDLLRLLGFEDNILAVNSEFPALSMAYYEEEKEQQRLNTLRKASINFLKNAISGI